MYIKVNLTPDAKKDFIRKAGPDKYSINVKDKPIRNLANKKMLAVLASELKVTPQQLKIIRGHRTPSKLISLQQDFDSPTAGLQSKAPDQVNTSKTKASTPKRNFRFKI